MYERFSDRARKVMQLSNQEALRYNHEYIGPEHILLGLLKEGSGVAANVMKNMDIDLKRLRHEVEKILLPGPDMDSMGKLPQTPSTRKVIELAIQSARELNHNYVGTEHLFLGVLGLPDDKNIFSKIFAGSDITTEKVKEEIMNLLGHNESPKSQTKQEVPPATDSTDILAFAARYFRDKLIPMLQKEVDEKFPVWQVIVDATLGLQKKPDYITWHIDVAGTTLTKSVNDVKIGEWSDSVSASPDRTSDEMKKDVEQTKPEEKPPEKKTGYEFL
jgi:hypothetical protein